MAVAAANSPQLAMPPRAGAALEEVWNAPGQPEQRSSNGGGGERSLRGVGATSQPSVHGRGEGGGAGPGPPSLSQQQVRGNG
jgi:hypothetical protein